MPSSLQIHLPLRTPPKIVPLPPAAARDAVEIIADLLLLLVDGAPATRDHESSQEIDLGSAPPPCLVVVEHPVDDAASTSRPTQDPSPLTDHGICDVAILDATQLARNSTCKAHDHTSNQVIDLGSSDHAETP